MNGHRTATEALIAKMHTDYAALEARCAGLHKQLADVLEISTAVPFDRCIIHAGERLAGRLMQVKEALAERDALQANLDDYDEQIDLFIEDHGNACANIVALQAKLAEAVKIVCDEAMDHQAHGFCDCPLCKYAAILAGHAPATKGEGDE